MKDGTDSTPTLLDIAKAAGVSTATVSRVLNRPDDVRPQLREQVEEIIRALGYVRHGAARALASSRSSTIGAVVPTLESAIFASGLNAVGQLLSAANYTLLLAVSDYAADQEYRQVRALIERGVDGMILVGREHAADTLDLLERHKCPFVTTWSFDAQYPHPCIGFDNIAASRQMAQHLIDLGHRRFAAIAGIRHGNDRARERIEGAAAALAARGLSFLEGGIIEETYDIEAGRRAFSALMDRPTGSRPTAIICGNDVLAVGAVVEAQQRGIAVPGEVSIVGFDDLPMAAHLPPGLTTVHVPSRRMGRLAAQYILDCAAGTATETHIELPTQLVIRGTAAAPPGS